MSISATRARQIGVASQLAGILTVAFLLVRHAGWPWPAALASGALAALAMFTVSIALAFLASGSGFGLAPGLRPPLHGAARAAYARAPRLGPREALACFAQEWIAVFRTFNWLQPFRSQHPFAPAAAPGRSAGPLPPLLLVHGYGCNHAVWIDMQPALARAGYHCEGIDLAPIFGDIDDLGQQVLTRMRAMRAHHGAAPVLVCHSMGGLVARAALALARREGEAGICGGVVTLGTPHHGCALARYGAGIDARQMRCGSPWLASLSGAEADADRAGIVSVFSWHDSISGPPGTAWLEGAHNVPLTGLGHLSLLRSPIAIEATLHAIAMLQRRQAPAATLAEPA